MTESVSEPNSTPTEQRVQSPSDRVHQAMADLKTVGDAGAGWFFWIAVLSLVNTAIAHSGGDRHFIVGLAITAIVDAIASELGKQQPETATVAMVIAVVFSVMVAGIVMLFGWLSRKRLLWGFGIGMFLYVLDGLIYLLIGDFLSAAFHGYALYSMIQGFNAYRKLSQIEAAIETDATSESTMESIADQGFETI